MCECVCVCVRARARACVRLFMCVSQADGGLIEVLQLAAQHAGDSPIDSLQGLSLNSDAPSAHAPLPTPTHQPAAQPSASDAGFRAATAPGVVSFVLLFAVTLARTNSL